MKDGVECEMCTFKFKDGVRCVIDPTNCGSYKPKSPDKVLGDTIFACVGCPNKFCCDIRDTHTHGEIAKRLEVIMTGWRNHKSIISEMIDSIDRLIKELEGE